MDTKLVPYNEAKYFDRVALDKGLYTEDTPAEERVKVLNQITSQNKLGKAYDFSQLAEASFPVRARSAVHEYTTGVYDKYAAPAILWALGDNKVGRVVSNTGRMIVDSAPELGIMLATRRPSAGVLQKWGGLLGAAGSAAANTYGQTADTGATTISGLTTFATPWAIDKVNKLLHRALPSLATRPVASAVASGAVANVPLTAVSAATTPHLSVDPDTGVLANTDPVNLFNVKENWGRMMDAVTDPEYILPALLSGAATDALIGHAMVRQAKAYHADEIARNKIRSIDEATDLPKEALEKAGIRVPENADNRLIEAAIKRLQTETALNTTEIAKELWRSVDASKLSEKEFAYRERLMNDSLMPSEIEEMEHGKFDATRDLSDEMTRRVLDAGKDILTTDKFAPEKANVLSKALDLVSRGFLSPRHVVEGNAVADAIYKNLNQIEGMSNHAQVEQLVRLGQNPEGSLTRTEAIAAVRKYANELTSNKELRAALHDILTEGNKSLNVPEYKADGVTPRMHKDGTPITRRRTIFDPIVEPTIEELAAKHNITREQAHFIKNLQAQAVHTAADTLSSRELGLSYHLADAIAKHLGADRYKALEVSRSLTKTLRSIAVQNLKEANGNSRNAFTDTAVKQVETYLNDLFTKLIPMEHNPEVIADLAKLAYTSELALVSNYAKTGVRGYTSQIRRGAYYIYAAKDDGIPMFKSYKRGEKAEFTAEAERLKREGWEVRTTDTTTNDLTPYQALHLSELEMLQSNLSNIYNDLLSSVSKENYSSIQEATSNIQKMFADLMKAERDIGLHQRASYFHRKGIEGASGEDMLFNTLDIANQKAAANTRARIFSTVDYLRKDATLTGDTKLAEYIDDLVRYVKNPKGSEWTHARNIASVMYLGGNLSHLFQNLTQVLILGPAAWKTFTGRSTADFTASYKRGLKLVKDYDRRSSSKIPNDDIMLRLMRTAEDRGAFEQAFSEEIIGKRKLQQEVRAKDDKTLWNKADEKFSDFIDWATQITSESESFNRKTAVAAFLESENKYKPLASRTPEELQHVIDQAIEFSNDVNFTGGRASRPYFVRMFADSKLHGAALTAMVLQSFSVMVGGKLVNYLRNAVPGLKSSRNVTSKHFLNTKDGSALFKALALMAATTGLYNLPGRKLFDMISGEIFGQDNRVSDKVQEGLASLLNYMGDDESEDEREFKSKILNSVMFGLPAYTGVTFPNITNQPFSMFGEKSNPRLSDLFGAAGQLASRVTKQVRAVASGDYQNFIANSPPILRQWDKYAKAVGENKYTSMSGTPYTDSSPKFRQPQYSLSTLVGGTPVEAMNAWARGEAASAVQHEQEEGRKDTISTAVHLVDDPSRLRALYAGAVEKGYIIDDPTAFCISVGEQLAYTKRPYDKPPSKETVAAIQKLNQIYRHNPVYLGNVEKYKNAIEVAIALGNKDAAMGLAQKIQNVDLQSDFYKAQGVPPSISAIVEKIRRGKTITPAEGKILSDWKSNR